MEAFPEIDRMGFSDLVTARTRIKQAQVPLLDELEGMVRGRHPSLLNPRSSLIMAVVKRYRLIGSDSILLFPSPAMGAATKCQQHLDPLKRLEHLDIIEALVSIA